LRVIQLHRILHRPFAFYTSLRSRQVSPPHKQLLHRIFAWLHAAHVGLNVIVSRHVLQSQRVCARAASRFQSNGSIPFRDTGTYETGGNVILTGPNHSRAQAFEDMATQMAPLFNPFFQRYGHSVTHSLPDRLANVCPYRQFMCAITQSHERTPKGVPIDSAPDLYQAAGSKELD
jgi:hypothetical protein